MNSLTVYKINFLKIVHGDPDQFANPSAARLLQELVVENIDSDNTNYYESAQDLSCRPEYGNGSPTFGVNVYIDADENYSEEFVSGDDCTWMTLEGLVDEAINASLWSWFEEDYVKQLAD